MGGRIQKLPMRSPQGEFMQPFEGFFDLVFIKYQKGGNEYG
jgi:hypothetical protein